MTSGKWETLRESLDIVNPNTYIYFKIPLPIIATKRLGIDDTVPKRLEF